MGRFESALIPDSAQQNFYLALEEALQPADQVALFGHAVAHLIKNHQDREAGQENLTLDPKNDRVHIDKLNELRYFDMAQSGDEINRRVLKACPKLQQLFEAPEESPAMQEHVKLSLESLLRRKRWTGLNLRMGSDSFKR